MKINNTMAHLLEIQSKSITDLRVDMQAELDTMADEMHDHLRTVRQEVRALDRSLPQQEELITKTFLRDELRMVTTKVDHLTARLSNITISLPPLDANQMGEKEGKDRKRRAEDRPEETSAKRFHR